MYTLYLEKTTLEELSIKGLGDNLSLIVFSFFFIFSELESKFIDYFHRKNGMVYFRFLYK